MIKKKMKIWAIAAVMLGSVSTISTADDLLQDAGSWMQIVGEGSLKVVDPKLEKGRIWLEGQSRFNDNWNHWYQGMVRTAVGYSLSERATIWAGYTWLPTQNVGKSYVSQQDVWPAFHSSSALPALYLEMESHRTSRVPSRHACIAGCNI